MEIYVQNRLHERVSQTTTDDAGQTFLQACRKAPRTSVMHGVQSLGDTMFNRLQAVQLAAELSQLPEDECTETIRRVIEMAREAAACRGYLYISGD